MATDISETLDEEIKTPSVDEEDVDTGENETEESEAVESPGEQHTAPEDSDSDSDSDVFSVGSDKDSLKLVRVDKGDTISEFVDKVNSNFQNIAQHGGGPAGVDGIDGKDGEDGTTIECIYALCTRILKGVNYPSSTANMTILFDNVISKGAYAYTYNKTSTIWSYKPYAISVNNPNQYVITRKSTSTGTKKTYSYSAPVLWSHYGDKGESYLLAPSSSSIKIDYEGNLSTSKLTCTVNTVFTKAGYSVYYNFDEEDKQAYTSGTNLIEIMDSSGVAKVMNADCINFYLATTITATPICTVTVPIFNESDNSIDLITLNKTVNQHTTAISMLSKTISDKTVDKIEYRTHLRDYEVLKENVDTLQDTVNNIINNNDDFITFSDLNNNGIYFSTESASADDSTNEHNFMVISDDSTTISHKDARLLVDEDSIMRNEMVIGTSSSNLSTEKYGDISTTIPVKIIKDNTYTLTSNDGLLILDDPGDGSQTTYSIVLPKPTDVAAGKWYMIKNIHGGQAMISSGTGTDALICPCNTVTLTTQIIFNVVSEIFINTGSVWVEFKGY